MDEPRSHVFAAAREACGRGLTQAEVDAGDAWCDLLGLDHAEPLLTGLRTSAAGRSLIKRWEGLKLVAYLCPAGVWTIGYGATGAGIRKGLVWSPEQAEARFERDLAEVEHGVHQLIAGKPCTQGQFDALVSFAYNCGLDIDADEIPEGLGDSTLLKKHRAGDYAGAAREFGKWINGGGRKLAGLVDRRTQEAALYRGA